MRYNIRNGFKISEIGVGCYSLSGVYGSVDIYHFQEMLRHAYELGVSFFDTAEGYGDAERVLGETVRPFREEIRIATKVGIREGIKPNLSKEYIYEACQRSLKQLGTEYIDLYQVHFDDPCTAVSETVASLDALVDEGKILQYGIGHLPPNRVEEYCKKGTPFSILMELSAVARNSRDEILPFCSSYNVAGIGFSTTGRGILTGKYGPETEFESGDIRTLDPLFRRARFESSLRITDHFKKLAMEYGVTTVQLAIAWVLSQSNIICALTGPSKIGHLEENVGASGLTIRKTDLEELENIFANEDALLAEEERRIIHTILTAPLPSTPHDAFADLVYALETSVLSGLLTEETVMPVLTELWPLKTELDKTNLSKLTEIQARLRTLLS